MLRRCHTTRPQPQLIKDFAPHVNMFNQTLMKDTTAIREEGLVGRVMFVLNMLLAWSTPITRDRTGPKKRRRLRRSKQCLMPILLLVGILRAAITYSKTKLPLKDPTTSQSSSTMTGPLANQIRPGMTALRLPTLSLPNF